MFSRITIIEAVEAFQFSTHASINIFELRFGLQTNGGIEPRVAEITRYLVTNSELKGPAGANLIFEIIEHLLELKAEHAARLSGMRWNEKQEAVLSKLSRALERDGYVIQDWQLVAMVPEDIAIVNKTSELEWLLVKHSFTTPKGHLDQALSAFNRGEWAAANSQLRSFIESLFDEIARRLDPVGAAATNSSQARRQLLANLAPPFFSPVLGEWVGQGNGFVEGFWKRLHSNGSHPGLSDEDDSTFRLHLVMIVARYFLKRFDT